ncbi:MAG: hypothetical protein Pars2KO_33420 [Parasphingorhabdus sp.]
MHCMDQTQIEAAGEVEVVDDTLMGGGETTVVDSAGMQMTTTQTKIKIRTMGTLWERLEQSAVVAGVAAVVEATVGDDRSIHR